MSPFLIGVTLPFILAAAEQLGQCAADSVEELVPLDDEALEFSLLQTSLSVSQSSPHKVGRSSLLTHVVSGDVAWRSGAARHQAANASSPLALVATSSNRTRDIIAWPGAFVLSLSFGVTLIFVVVLWTVMLEAHQASKALAPQNTLPRGTGIAGGPSRARAAGAAGVADGQGPDCASGPPAVEEVRHRGLAPRFGGSMGSTNRGPVPIICPALSLLQGAAQFRIPVESLDLLKAGYFPIQILGPSGKPLLHAWLPLCSKTPPQPPAQAQLGYLLQLTTSAAVSTRHPHASIGLLQAGAKDQKAEIFGPKNQKYGHLCRSNDKWLVYYHSEGSEQLALSLHHMPAALGFCAYSADGRQVATATRIQSPGETLSISVNPGGDAMLALLCILAVVLSMLENVVPPSNEAPAALPPNSLPPGYADASAKPSSAPSTAPVLKPNTSGASPRSLPAFSRPGSGALLSPQRVPVVRTMPPTSDPNVPNFAARPSPQP